MGPPGNGVGGGVGVANGGTWPRYIMSPQESGTGGEGWNAGGEGWGEGGEGWNAGRDMEWMNQ